MNETNGGSGYRPLSDYSGAGGLRFTSDWCLQCGKRRGGDGRCSDCDGWWTSPLFTIGAPVIAFATLALLSGIVLLRRQMPLPNLADAPLLSSPIVPASDSAGILVLRPRAPLAAPPAAPVAPPAAPITANVLPSSQNTVASEPSDPVAEQRRLRRMTEFTGAIVREQYGRRLTSAWDARHVAAVGAPPPVPQMSPFAGSRSVTPPPSAFRQPVFQLPAAPPAPISPAPPPVQSGGAGSGETPTIPASPTPAQVESTLREI